MRIVLPLGLLLFCHYTVIAQEEPKNSRQEAEKVIPPEKDPPLPEKAKPFPAKQNKIYLETLADGSRRVHLLAEVCFREGPLEALLCKSVTKEHESVLHMDVDGKLIHAALIAAQATPGSPAIFGVKDDVPFYKPAHGSPIRIELSYYLDGKLQQNVSAKEFVLNERTKKTLESDWVFAGSRFVKLPDNPTGPEIYTANGGDFISIANFPDSMLDLPVRSSNVNEDRTWIANTKKIPTLGTKVLVTLIPLKEKK